MDREGNFSIDECISECMQNRIEPSEAIERMKTMQQHMPGLNYSTTVAGGGDKGIRQNVSQPSYMQTGPPVFPEPIPSSAMRHPGPQYFEENRVMAHSQGASLGFSGFVQNRFPLVEGFPGNPFAQPSPLPLNQNQMGFSQMGFNRPMQGVLRPETSTAGFQKPDQFSNPETSMASTDNAPEKLTAVKKKDKVSTGPPKIIGPQKESIPTSVATSQPQAGGAQGTTSQTSQPGIVKTTNPIMQKQQNIMPFAKKNIVQKDLKDLLGNIERLRKSLKDLESDKKRLESDIHNLEQNKDSLKKGKTKKKIKKEDDGENDPENKKKFEVEMPEYEIVSVPGKRTRKVRKIKIEEPETFDQKFIKRKRRPVRPNGLIKGEIDPDNPDKPPSTSKSGKRKRNRKPGPPKQCEVCKKWFTTGSYLTTHMRIHTGERPYHCDTCGKSFKDMSTWTIHRRIHTGEKPWTCTVCGKAFTSSAHAKNHMLVHTGEKPHACEYCGKCFSQRGNLITHRRSHTGEKPFKCEVCGKAYAQKDQLNTHMFSHTGERPYECEICHKKYTKKFHLKEHYYVHTLDSQFTCDICQRNFSQAIELTKHKLRHFEAKPHACDICGKHFRRYKDVGQHKRIHTNYRPHKCTYCGKGFRAPNDLKRHMFVHTGESPHQCNLCGKRFHSAYPLKRHMVQHSDDDPLATLIERRNTFNNNDINNYQTGVNSMNNNFDNKGQLLGAATNLQVGPGFHVSSGESMTGVGNQIESGVNTAPGTSVGIGPQISPVDIRQTKPISSYAEGGISVPFQNEN